MFFVPVMWTGYEVACLTPSGRAAIGVTDEKVGRLLAHTGGDWRILYEWPVARLSHTEVLTHLGDRPEPPTPQDILLVIKALDETRERRT
jgi:hypothetical protein